MSELEEWSRRGVIGLEWSEPIYDELSRDAPDGRHWRKSCGILVAHPSTTNPNEIQQLAEIERVVFPGGSRDKRERIDALAIFTAWKYRAIFVTDDGSGGKARGILTHKKDLASLGVQVVTDEEAVAIVRGTLSALAKEERHHMQESGEPEPSWVELWYSKGTK